MVDGIRERGLARTAAVEKALREVERHLFVPDTPLAEAYENTAVFVKWDDAGAMISCASQPSVVAAMLDQLDIRSGQRVLEIGAGTGYNAALLGHLVGEHGHVVSIDVDADLVENARARLGAAAIGNVQVVLGDGALGYAPGAPYDRIVATVGAHGVPPAWLDQLAPHGRLLVPQRLAGSVCRSIAYERHDGWWRSVSSKMNTFVPLRRGVADDDRRIVPISADGAVQLQTAARDEIDAAALAGVLNEPGTERWTGVTVGSAESAEWMELYLACAYRDRGGLIRMLFDRVAGHELLADRPYSSSSVIIDGGTLVYLVFRIQQDGTAAGGGRRAEFGVVGHGPGSTALTASVADTIRTWDRVYRGREATFEIEPLDGARRENPPGRVGLTTPLNRIVVDWTTPAA